MSVILENATVTYGIKKKVTALDQVTLSVDPGSIFGLLGPSGCGKTTLISCCLGITKPQPGRVSTCGQIPLYPGHGVPGSMVISHSYLRLLFCLSRRIRFFNPPFFSGWLHASRSHSTLVLHH